MLLGGVGHSEDALIFWSIAPWHAGVQVMRFQPVFSPHAKIGSCAINAPLKTPWSRGGFCYPLVILLGKRDPDFR